jgi:glycosyltransferase involved in cell wall biosynthesis
MPKVSVVIPTYNSANYLSDAIDSVMNQTVQCFEIIVVDDGSFDDTKNILTPYLKDIRYFYQDNAGSAKARNVGINAAKGEWIAFLDSDDYWENNHIEMMVSKHKKNPEADLIYGGKRWVDQYGNQIKDVPLQTVYPEGWIFSELFYDNYISTSSTVFARRSVLIDLCGFNEQPVFRNAQDYDMWLRLAANSMIVSIPELAVKYRRHDNNKTLNTARRVRGVLSALNNAVFMIKANKVHQNNHPEQIKISKRMKTVYKNFSFGLFYAENYKEVRKIGFDGITKGYFSLNLIMIWCLSWMRPEFINGLRKYVQYLKS